MTRKPGPPYFPRGVCVWRVVIDDRSMLVRAARDEDIERLVAQALWKVIIYVALLQAGNTPPHKVAIHLKLAYISSTCEEMLWSDSLPIF